VVATPGAAAERTANRAPAARHRRVDITGANVSTGGCHPVHWLSASISIRKRA
jgi:hypothetical protein